MYHFLGRQQPKGLGQVPTFTSLYCSNVKRTCVIPSVKAEAIERCQQGSKWSANKSCDLTFDDTISDLDKGHFSPCTVANEIPVCGEEGGDEDGLFDEQTTYVVGGILGLIVVGGIAYAVMRKKKKKGRK